MSESQSSAWSELIYKFLAAAGARDECLRRTWTGPAGQYQDAHGFVYYDLALPSRRQKRSRKGLLADYNAMRRA